MQFLNVFDIILPPLYLMIILIIASIIKNKKIKKYPEYKYFIPGLMVKVIGGIFVVFVYCFYYVGGDTIAYFESTVALNNMLLMKSPATYLSILAGNSSWENISVFDSSTGWPMYWRDPQSFSVVRFTSLLTLISFKSFLTTTILVATLTYTGIWKLFQLFRENFVEIEKNIAIAILFMPSVFFWGSGVLKDSYTICAASWLIVSVYYLFFKKEKIGFYLLALIISIYVLISLKPYIFFAAAAGCSIMIAHYYFKHAKNILIKYTIMPMVVVMVLGSGGFLLIKMGSSLGGDYANMGTVIKKITVMQQDLVKEYYGENTFDIGAFEPTISGLLGKAPAAMIAGTFRPFIWECRNPIMMISGVENTAILFLFIYVILLSAVALFKTGFKYMLATTFDNSLVIFSLIFSFSFAFFVGISTANFGALVRYKIPLIPFLMASLFIIIRKYNREKETEAEKRKREKEENEAKRSTPSPRKPGGSAFPYIS